MKPERILTNNTPVFAWGFMMIWMGMLCLFTWLYFRDGSPGAWFPFVLGLFWIFGIGASGHLFSTPRVEVWRTAEGLSVREKWLTSHRDETVTLDGLELVEGKDDDGAPYFLLYLAAGSRRILVKESHDRATVEAARDRLLMRQ